MRTTIDLPEPLLKNAKLRAAQRGVTLSVVVEDALRGHLASRITAPASRFELHTVRGRLAAEGLDLDRTSELIAQEDELEFGQSEPRR
jgi:hypothetical protein